MRVLNQQGSLIVISLLQEFVAKQLFDFFKHDCQIKITVIDKK
jgi:hypothetical protein